MKKVSVVILNWNGKALLEKYLPSVIQNTNSDLANIVVADNASTDDSVQFINQNYPQVRIIALAENFGFAEGYNQALKMLDTEFLVLLNSDVRVAPLWLEPLISSLESNKDIVAVQPKIKSERNSEYFEYAGASGGFIDKYGYPFCRGRLFESLEKDLHQYDTPIDIFWASGACLVIRSKAYFEVGGLDQSFFAHMEEIDLCWRLNARGYKLMCVPQSTVYHVGGATLDQESPKKTFLNFRNNLLMLYKNLPEQDLTKVLRIRFFLDYLAAFQMLVKGRKDNYRAILQAHSEFKKIKDKYKSTRDENINRSTKAAIKTIYPKSILWSYFIQNRKSFNKLRW